MVRGPRSCLLVLGALAVAGCASAYRAGNFDSYAVAHRTVAVLPFDVSIGAASRRSGSRDAELEAEALSQARAIQRALYERLVAGQHQGRYTVVFRDIDVTNARVQAMEKDRKAEVAEVLGVDAVVSGRVVLLRPLGPLATLVSLILPGASGLPNHAHMTVTIHDGASGDLIWKFEEARSGDALYTTNRQVASLLDDAESQFPYRR